MFKVGLLHFVNTVLNYPSNNIFFKQYYTNPAIETYNLFWRSLMRKRKSPASCVSKLHYIQDSSSGAAALGRLNRRIKSE